MSTIKYRPEVDGLRAVAVIPVILFHLGVSWITGGFTGVDVFFVISGYLITSIILKDFDSGSFTFRNFWMRRVRRIMPVLMVVLLSTAVAGYWLLFGPNWKGLGRQLISVVFMMANVEMWHIAGNYWGAAAENAPLLHTWSLSVEEQFYLIYPIFMILMLRFARKALGGILILGIALSFGLCVYVTEHWPGAAFYFLPPRAWELACGGLLALIGQRGLSRLGTRGSSVVCLIGLALLVAGYIGLDATSFPGSKALVPVIGSMMLIYSTGAQRCLVTKLLSSVPFVLIGKISYSLYLWHWPVIVLGRAYGVKYDTELNYVLLGGIILGLSILSYYFVERLSRRAARVYIPVGIATACCLLAGCTLMHVNYDYDVSRFSPTVWAGEAYNVLPRRTELPEIRTIGVEWFRRPDSQLTAFETDGVLKVYGDARPAVVVFGSSHGLMWAPVIDEICAELGVSVSFFTADATNPFIDLPLRARGTSFFSAEEKYVFDKNRLEKLRRWRPQIVFISDRWSSRINIDQYKDFLQSIRATGAVIKFIEQPPELEIGDVSAPLFFAFKDSSSRNRQQADERFVRCANQESVSAGSVHLREVCKELDFCELVPVADLFLQSGKVLAMKGGEIFYIDDDHLSFAGAHLAKNRIKSAIEDSLK